MVESGKSIADSTTDQSASTRRDRRSTSRPRRQHHHRSGDTDKQRKKPNRDERKRTSSARKRSGRARNGESEETEKKESKHASATRKRRPERSKRKENRHEDLDASYVTESTAQVSLQQKYNTSFEIDSPRRHNSSLHDDATSTVYTESNASMTHEQRAWAGVARVLRNSGGDDTSVSTSEVLPPALIGALRDMKRGSVASATQNSASSRRSFTSRQEDSSGADDSQRDGQSMPSLMDASFMTTGTDLQSLASRMTTANKVISGNRSNENEPLAQFCNQITKLASQASQTPLSHHEQQKNAAIMQNYLRSLIQPEHDVDSCQKNQDSFNLESMESAGNGSSQSLSRSGSSRFQDSTNNKSLGQLLPHDDEEEPVFFQPSNALNLSMPSIATYEETDNIRDSMKKNASLGDVYTAIKLEETEAEAQKARDSMKKSVSFGDLYTAIAGEDVDESDEDSSSESETDCEYGASKYTSNKSAFLEHSMHFGDFATPQLVIPGVDELTVTGSETKPTVSDPKPKRRKSQSKSKKGDRRSVPRESREPGNRVKHTRRKRRKSAQRSSKAPPPSDLEVPSEQFASFLPNEEDDIVEEIRVSNSKRRFPLFKIPLPSRFRSTHVNRARDYLSQPTTSLKSRLSTMFMKVSTARKASDETIPSREEACFFPDEKPNDQGDNMLLPW